MKSSCALDDKNNIVQLVGYRVRTRGDIGLNPMSCFKIPTIKEMGLIPHEMTIGINF